jgi:hypothetical protein
MQPLKPHEKDDIIVESAADPAEIAEYEQLLAEMFTIDPDGPPLDPSLESVRDTRQARLDELAKKLFPGGIKQG